MDDPELLLVIASCRAAYSGEIVPDHPSRVRWDRLLMLAQRHRVQALCWQGLGETEAPAEIAGQLAAQSRHIVSTNLRATVECARLQAGFAAAEVDLLFLKGLTLAALAYPQPMLKMGWDIDILVAHEQLADAANILRNAGYELEVPTGADGASLGNWHAVRKESAWRHAKGGFMLDLHTGLADHPSLLPEIGMNSPRQLVKLAAGIELPTLAKDELFAYLCVHGASSCWFRLKWLCDLAALLHRETGDEIARLYDRSQQLGAGRAADQALILASRVFGIGLSEELQQRLAASGVSRWLARLAEAQLSNPREPTERLLGTATIHLTQPFLLPGCRYSLSELAHRSRGVWATRTG